MGDAGKREGFFKLDSLGKALLLLGGFIALTGLLLLLFGRLGLGRLPGDIVVQKERFTFYFPIVTMLVISAILTLLINLAARLFK